jgi:alkylation response protein AidB-like acyl-CoA dehydrogenase
MKQSVLSRYAPFLALAALQLVLVTMSNDPATVVTAAWACGIGDYALNKGVDYANQRAPFGTPIGAYQGLQHPLARAKANLDAARLMMYTAAKTFDDKGDAGYLANAAKLLASEAAVNTVDSVIQTVGGYAFTAEYDVSSLWPMARLLRIAPVNNEMVLNYIGEHVLGLPKSY